MPGTHAAQKQPPRFRDGLPFGLALGLLEVWFFVDFSLHKPAGVSWVWVLLPLFFYLGVALLAGVFAGFRWRAAHAGTDLGGATGLIGAIVAGLLALVFVIIYANLPAATLARASTPGIVTFFFVVYFVPLNFIGLVFSLLAGRIGGMLGLGIRASIQAISPSGTPSKATLNQQQPEIRSG